MKRSEAPRPGWYPDPEGGARLRYWEGDDWSDRYRPRPPSDARQIMVHSGGQVRPAAQQAAQYAQQAGQYAQQRGQVDSAQIVEQVRRAAREEAQRASELFGAQARAATRNITPLITEYTTKIARVFRFLSVIAIILVVLYVGFQVWAQQSFFDWLGDRIDNVLDRDDNGGVIVPLTRWW